PTKTWRLRPMASADACSQTASPNNRKPQSSHPARASPSMRNAIRRMQRQSRGGKSGGTSPASSGVSSISTSVIVCLSALGIVLDVVARDTEPQIVLLGIGHGRGLVTPHGERAGIARLFFRGFHAVNTRFVPEDLKALRRRRLGNTSELDAPHQRSRL